jgi:hypothetical protein
MHIHAHWRMLIVLGLFMLGSNSAAQSFNFTSVDVPCSNCPGGIARRTAPGGINSAGEIVGVYTDAVGKSNGFLLRDEEFITIEVPGSLVGVAGTLPTVARGISPSGEVVGQFTAPYNPPASTSAGFDSPAYCPAAGSAACIKGFLYRHGHFSAVLFPGHPGAIPGRITRDGSIYGCLHDFDLMNSMFSAAWNRFGDTSLTAGGGALTDPNQSFPNSMHGGATPDGDTVVGFYVDMMTNHTHGYVLQDGVLRPYDVPNSIQTIIWDINPRQELVGTYKDVAGKQHGFLQLPNESAPITIDVPNGPPFNAVSTIAMGINPRGVIVGQFTDSSGHTHGFRAVPAEERSDDEGR